MPIDTPALAVADNGDDSGVTCTITGGEAGATNVVKYAAVDGNQGTITLTTLDSRSGPGAVTGDPGNGYFFFLVESSDSGETVVSNLVYRAVTDGVTELWDRIGSAVVAKIKLLALASIANKVYSRTEAAETTTDLPCCVVSWEGLGENLAPSTNTQDDWRLPVRVILFEHAPPAEEPAAIRQRRIKWRRQVGLAFSRQRLTGVSEVHDCEVAPQTLVAPSTMRRSGDFIGSGLTLTFVCRLARALSS